MVVAQDIPEEVVARYTLKVHQGICPKCRKEGPIDVHTSHQIYSLLIYTSYKSTPVICCRSCGIKNQVTDLFGSIILGWWGIPWGVLMTPVQIMKNIAGMITGPNPSTPSDQLHGMVSHILAKKVIAKEEAAEKYNKTYVAS